MDSRSAPLAIDNLLLHANWLRLLANHVARGEEEGEDAVQNTWLAALRTPPAAGLSARPWLAEVMRNFVRRSARQRQARRRREQADEGRALAPSPESLLERAEAQRRLATLVVALDEPYRTTVLLRYYEGLTAAAIARMGSVPAGTVRWRLSEALRRLSIELEADRETIRLLGVLVTPRARDAPSATGLWTGGLIMAAKK